MKRSLLIASLAAVVASPALASVVPGSYTFGGSTTPTNQVGPWKLTGDALGDFSVLRFVPTTAPVFSTVNHLSYAYDSVQGGIGGGTPRAAFVLDFNNDLAPDGQILVHWGPAASFVDPTIANGLNTGNLMSLTDLGRWDLSGIGQSAYTDYATALSFAGSYTVLRVSLVVDSFNTVREFNMNSVLVEAVPAPGALALLGVGAVFTGRRRRA